MAARGATSLLLRPAAQRSALLCRQAPPALSALGRRTAASVTTIDKDLGRTPERGKRWVSGWFFDTPYDDA